MPKRTAAIRTTTQPRHVRLDHITLVQRRISSTQTSRQNVPQLYGLQLTRVTLIGMNIKLVRLGHPAKTYRGYKG